MPETRLSCRIIGTFGCLLEAKNRKDTTMPTHKNKLINLTAAHRDPGILRGQDVAIQKSENKKSKKQTGKKANR